MLVSFGQSSGAVPPFDPLLLSRYGSLFLTRPTLAYYTADRAELFRRVVFNALISNLDDHPRNHALIAPGQTWHLAPAYDLTPTPAISIERRDLALECGPHGRMARRDNLVAAAPRFGLEGDEASAIIDEMVQTVRHHWHDDVRRLGGAEGDCRVIEPAFVYPGFEYPTNRASGGVLP